MAEKTPKVKNNVNGGAIDRKTGAKRSSADKDSGIDETETHKASEEDRGGAPIDRGWAWVVLAACAFEFMVFGGIMRSFGVFFLQYQMRFNSNASETAVMNLIQNVIISTTALFVMTIGLRKFSSRVSVFTGGTLTVIAFLITAFTTDIRVFYFAQGVIGGIGFAMILPPMLAIIGVYFDKHRGLANSIFSSGGSVGGLIFAPVVVKLFDEYQFTGAMLIVSGIFMNIWVFALLMRPIESYSKKKMKFVDEGTDFTQEEKPLLKQDSGNDKEYIDSAHLTFDEIKLASNVLHSDNQLQVNFMKQPHINATEFTRMQSYDPDIINKRHQGPPLLPRANSFGNRKRIISEDNNTYVSESNIIQQSKSVLKGVVEAISRSHVAIYTSGEGVCGSFIDVNNISTEDCPNNNDALSEREITDTKGIAVGCCSNMKSCLSSVLRIVFDINLLRNPVFITFLFMAFTMMSGLALVPFIIPIHAKDIGISNEKIGLLISLMAVIDLVSKVTMGVVTDKKWIERSTLLVIVTAVLGTSSHLMRFVNSFPTMVIYVVIAGVCSGQYMSVYAALLMEVIGQEKFKSSLGFGTLIHGMSLAIFFQISGLLRDVTGSYVASFHLLGGLAYLAGVLAFIIPHVNKWKKEKEGEEIKDP